MEVVGTISTPPLFSSFSNAAFLISALTKSFSENDVIMPSLIEGKRTIAGRYVNHDSSPNAKMVFSDNGDAYLVAIKDIGKEEITTDYRDTLKLQIKKAV